MILERATMLQALGLYQLSARDFEAADKSLELLDIARDGAGKLGKYIYSDSATKYKTSPTEKLSLNAMNMCNYLARGDLDGREDRGQALHGDAQVPARLRSGARPRRVRLVSRGVRVRAAR